MALGFHLSYKIYLSHPMTSYLQIDVRSAVSHVITGDRMIANSRLIRVIVLCVLGHGLYQLLDDG